MSKIFVLITCSPHEPNAKSALDYAKSALADNKALQVFFYGDGAYTANRLRWQTADVVDVADGWQVLHDEHGLALPVCVGTALARGVSDGENAMRHGLDGNNLKEPFYLVGLSELALSLDDDTTLIQF